MSDFPNAPQDPYASPQAAQKPGMSSGAKLLLILGILFLLCVILCCGGMAFVFWRASAYMEDAVSTDPATIDQRRGELLEIQVPEGFKPEMSIDMAVPFTDSRLMTIVGYEGNSGNSFVLVGIGDILSDMPKEQMEQEIDNSLRQQGIGQPDPGTDWEVSEKEFDIGGKPTKFAYHTAKNEDGEPTRYHVTGMVDGKRGPVLIVLTVDVDEMSEEEIGQIIESIK